MIVFEILLWLFLGIAVATIIGLFIYVLIDDIKIRRVYRYFEAIGYKSDWILEDEIWYPGFVRKRTHKLDDVVLWKDVAEMTLKEIKQTYK